MQSDSLSERYSVPVLVYIYNTGGEIKFSDLKEIVNNFPTLEKLIKKMEEDELVETRKVLKPYKTNFVKLTYKGHNVAKKLQEATAAMNGTLEPETNFGILEAERMDVRGQNRIFSHMAWS